MPIQPKYPKEGDLFSSADMNTLFADIQTWVNDVAHQDISRESLMEEHLPPFLERGGFPNGFTKVGPDMDISVGGGARYMTRIGPDHATPRAFWQFSTSGVSAPYGPDSTTASDGWRIPAHDASGALSLPDAAELQVFPTDLTDVFGLHVKASVEHLYTHVDDVLTGPFASKGVRIAIGWTDSTGARHVHLPSVRMFTSMAHGKAAITTSTVLRDVDLGGLTLSSVFLVVSGGSVVVTPADPDDFSSVHLGCYDISVMPLRAGA